MGFEQVFKEFLIELLELTNPLVFDMGFNLYAGNYKLLLVIPFILTFVLVYLAFVSPGLTQGLDIKGGTLLMIQTESPVDGPGLESHLENQFDLLDLKITTTSFGVRVQYADSAALGEARVALLRANQELAANPVQAKIDAQLAVSHTTKYLSSVPDLSGMEPGPAVTEAQNTLIRADETLSKNLQDSIFSFLNIDPANARIQKRQIGAALGQVFWNNALYVTFLGVVGILIVIYFFFRELVPTLGIVFAAVFDILAGLAFMALLQIPLSLATIPALLMLIGYSIDGEILLSTRILKKKRGDDLDHAMDSFGTGMTMTLTALAAVSVMLGLSFFTGISVVYEIGAVLFGGLVGDIIVTWLFSAPMVLWYSETKKRKKVAA